MSQQEEADDFYAAGRKVAEYMADSKGKDISIATLQALIRDFLPQHDELQEALRSIVARPEFLQLVQLAGSGTGAIQNSAFIANLTNIYSAKTVGAADRLARGIMGLGLATIQNDSEVDTDKSNNNNDFYMAGFELSRQTRELGNDTLSAKRAQALLKYYLPQHEEILEALQSIVARPSFTPLLKSPNGEVAVVRKHSVIASIKKTYSQDVILAAENLINGLLRLDERTAPHLAAKKTRNQYSKTITQQEHSPTTQNEERVSAAQSSHKGRNIKPALLLIALSFFSIAVASIGYNITSDPTTQGDVGPKVSSQTQRNCPTDLDANPTTVSSATEVTLTSKGVRWSGIGYLGGLRELHNGAFAGEKTYKLKGGIAISTDNPRALYVRFGECPAIPMSRANYQQLRGKWDYGPKPSSHPSCIPGNKVNPLLVNCLPKN